MTEKAPIKEISFRQKTEFFDDYPEYRASTERALRQGLIDLGLEPEANVTEERLPARPADAFYPFPVPAMTVLTLRAKP